MAGEHPQVKVDTDPKYPLLTPEEERVSAILSGRFQVHEGPSSRHVVSYINSQGKHVQERFKPFGFGEVRAGLVDIGSPELQEVYPRGQDVLPKPVVELAQDVGLFWSVVWRWREDGTVGDASWDTYLKGACWTRDDEVESNPSDNQSVMSEDNLDLSGDDLDICVEEDDGVVSSFLWEGPSAAHVLDPDDFAQGVSLPPITEIPEAPAERVDLLAPPSCFVLPPPEEPLPSIPLPPPVDVESSDEFATKGGSPNKVEEESSDEFDDSRGMQGVDSREEFDDSALARSAKLVATEHPRKSQIPAVDPELLARLSELDMESEETEDAADLSARDTPEPSGTPVAEDEDIDLELAESIRERWPGCTSALQRPRSCPAAFHKESSTLFTCDECTKSFMSADAWRCHQKVHVRPGGVMALDNEDSDDSDVEQLMQASSGRPVSTGGLGIFSRLFLT